MKRKYTTMNVRTKYATKNIATLIKNSAAQKNITNKDLLQNGVKKTSMYSVLQLNKRMNADYKISELIDILIETQTNLYISPTDGTFIKVLLVDILGDKEPATNLGNTRP